MTENTGRTTALRDAARALMRDVVLPAEPRHDGAHGVSDALRAELQEAARAAGVFAPLAPERYGGLGLGLLDGSVLLEEAGRSVLGPQALNCAAPDEGNMAMLEHVATPEQQERYLRPLAEGRVRSCFSMTEPAPGAGSDPTLLRTVARRTDRGWSISGRKWFITGAEGAAFTICMARTEGGDGATMFLVDAESPGWHVERIVGSIDRGFAGGHAEVVFEECEVTDEAVLGGVGTGFRCAQVRLAPARLTHCMRWLGAAVRAQEIALDRASEREAFGARLGELGMVQAMLADSEIDLHASRLLIRDCAALLDRGEPAKQESSIAKTFVAEAVGRVVDRAVQVCGSLGVSEDLPLAQLLAEVRPFRIYDGPSETHRWSIARRSLRRRAAEREGR